MATERTLPQFPYGAVYFRKSNPPAQDWDRDYRVAAADGFNVFRHWFLWGAIEVAPGVYDWADYDAQLELGERHGISTIIAEISHSAPEWAFHDLAGCRFVDRTGAPVTSEMRDSSVSGGFPGLCLDHADARAAVAGFLTALVRRYRDHPSLAGYDVWNESNLHSSGRICFCPATTARFRTWLRERYGDLAGLSRAWQRYSYTDWDQVEPPRQARLYPECLDWAEFVLDNAYEKLAWRVDLVRGLDDHHPITAHGVDDQSLGRLTSGADHAWRAGAAVDVYGFTGGSPESRFRGTWKHWSSADITRSGADGKPFWSAEMAAGPNWNWAQHYAGHPRDAGGLPRGDDIRLHSLTSMAAGASGIFTNRWRPLLDGPKFGSLAFYRMDGGRTDRSEMARELSTWANRADLADLWRAAPVRGDIGLLVIEESQWQRTLLDGTSDHYAESLRGAYRGFFDNNIQADWISLDQLGAYDVAYLPCPTMLTRATVRRLTDWVEQGGVLVSEGCPGYFGDHGRAGAVQPHNGLDRLFGAVESDVEFYAGLLEQEGTTFVVDSAAPAAVSLFRQRYEAREGQGVGEYSDGGCAVVDHRPGRGRTRLVGTSPGAGYWARGDEGTRRFFSEVLQWAGRQPLVRRSSAEITGRLHRSADHAYLWLVNHGRGAVTDTVEVELGRPTRPPVVLWGAPDAVEQHDGGRLTVRVAGFDAVVLQL